MDISKFQTVVIRIQVYIVISVKKITIATKLE